MTLKEKNISDEKNRVITNSTYEGLENNLIKLIKMGKNGKIEIIDEMIVYHLNCLSFMTYFIHQMKKM